MNKKNNNRHVVTNLVIVVSYLTSFSTEIISEEDSRVLRVSFLWRGREGWHCQRDCEVVQFREAESIGSE